MIIINQTCLNENLLPTFTNIYIYIYIYIYILLYYSVNFLLINIYIYINTSTEYTVLMVKYWAMLCGISIHIPKA